MALTWYDGRQEREETFTVCGIIDADDFSRVSDSQPGDHTLSFLLPDVVLQKMAGDAGLTGKLVIKTDMDKDEQIEDSLNALLEEYPYYSLDTLRENILETESMFTLLFSVMDGISLFIIAFALINLLNTLITNILTRGREFAMLQSVGMTRKQLAKMLRVEGLTLSAGNLLITLVFGTAAGYLMIWLLRYFGADYMHFVFPVWLSNERATWCAYACCFIRFNNGRTFP